MKKRTPLIIAALVTAVSLLAVTAYANVPTYKGYEAFKTLIKNNNTNDDFYELENGTATGSLTIQEDNVILLNIDGTIKADSVLKEGSGTLAIESGKVNRDLTVFFNEDFFYLFDEANQEFYRSANTHNDDIDSGYYDGDDESGSRYGDSRFDDREMTSAQEELLDFIVGDLKDDFEVENNADDSQTITLELTKDEMPMLLNLIMSANKSVKDRPRVQDEKLSTMEELSIYPLFKELSTLKDSVVIVEENLDINFMKLSFTIDKDNKVKDMSFSLNVTGDDANGVTHTQQVDGKVAFSAFGETVADQPVLDNKTITEIDKSLFDHGNMSETGRRGRR